VPSFRATENIFTGNRTQDSFSKLWLCSCNILLETNNTGLGAVLLRFSVSELHKPSSPGLENRTGFQGCGLCSCYLPFETNNFCLGAILLSFPSYRNRPHRDSNWGTFQEFWPSYILFLVSRSKHAKFDANRLIRSRAISEHTYLHIQIVNFIYGICHFKLIHIGLIAHWR
jgi:hypothetical protein